MGITEEQDHELRKLMLDAQSGVQDSYARALRICAEVLRGFVQRRLMDRNLVEDVVQEGLLSIHKARHSYDPSKPFAPWFFSIARSRVCDHLRKESRYRNLLRRKMDQVEESAFAHAHVNGNGIEILGSLPEKQRKVVELLKFQDLSVKEVAKRLNMSETSVKVTAHRAYKVLRAEYE